MFMAATKKGILFVLDSLRQQIYKEQRETFYGDDVGDLPITQVLA